MKWETLQTVQTEMFEGEIYFKIWGFESEDEKKIIKEIREEFKYSNCACEHDGCNCDQYGSPEIYQGENGGWIVKQKVYKNI